MSLIPFAVICYNHADPNNLSVVKPTETSIVKVEISRGDVALTFACGCVTTLKGNLAEKERQFWELK